MSVAKSGSHQMFKENWSILGRAKRSMIAIDTSETDLIREYQVLVEQYEKLLKLTQKMVLISDRQSSLLIKQENDLKNLLNYSNQGFLSFGQDLLVQRQYSMECIRIFGTHIYQANIVHLLWSRSQRSRIETLLHRLFEAGNESEQQHYLDGLPRLLQVDGKDIHVEYRVISSEHSSDTSVKVMMILTDITERLSSEAQVEYLSYHDGLTSLYNRAYVDKVMDRMTSPDCLPLSMIIADMNGLKLTNDVFGHQKGDELLLRAVSSIKSCCRKQDVVARWGGDEFMILLPRTTQEECEAILKTIHDESAKEPADPVRVSFSLGCATMYMEGQRAGELFSAAEANMYRDKLKNSAAVREKVLEGMFELLYDQKVVDRNHIDRTLQMAVRFAALLGIHQHSMDMRNIRMLALLHDVGKIALPASVFLKPGTLTNEEWEIVKSHSEKGYRVANSLGESVLAEAILAMHERWDGAGYPYGLSGGEIPFLSRLMAIVDTYDVLTHDRVYKQAVSREYAIGEIGAQSGKQFDPMLTGKFLEHIEAIAAEL